MAAKAKKNDIKTRETGASVAAFLNQVKDETRRKDCRKILAIMEKVTGEKARMWGASIVGFGSYHYVYASGHEADWPLTAFSPRKGDLTVYIVAGFDGQDDLLAKLGKHKLGRSCLYLKGLEGIDEGRLTTLIARSVATIKKRHPARG